jgi:biotin carboxylase
MARAMGLFVVGADPDPYAPALAMAQSVVICDLADAGVLIRAAERQEIQGAMTFAADYPMPALAQVWSELKLSGPDAATVARATNKAEMRLAFQDAGVPGPEFAHVHSARAACDAARRIGGHVILKPAQSSGGRGVTRVAAGAADPSVVKAYASAAEHSHHGQGVVVEAFVDGPEYSVETITWRGQSHVIAITDKLTSGAPYFVELGHQQPSEADERTRAVIAEVALRAVRALGIDNAAGHVELRIARDGPWLMECAARAGGGCITSHLVPLSTGVNMVGACISIALGDAPDLQAATTGRAAAVRFLTTRPGRIVEVYGVADARRMQGIAEVETYFEPGHDVGELRDATARCGHVIATGSNVQEAAQRAEAARNHIAVSTRLR